MHTFLRILAGTLAGLALHGAALAQAFPARPLTLVIPFSPGGGTDTVQRAIADRMSAILGQRIVPENRPGAGGAVAAALVAKARPDGYTLFGYGGASLTPAFVKNLSFDMMKDFMPVGQTQLSTFNLLTSAASPAGASLRSLAAYGKANPGKLTFGSASHLSRAGISYIARTLGIEAPVVLYKGSADVASALARGEIDAAIDGTSPSVRAQIGAGRIRNIAVLSTQKNPAAPEVATVVEQGMPELVLPTSSGIWVPAGTPPEVVRTLNAALNQALQDPHVQEVIRQQGHQPTGGTPEEFRQFIQKESAFWTDAARRAGMQPD